MNLFIQETADITTESVTLVHEESESLIELIKSGGPAGMIIVSVLTLLLLFALYIYFERLMKIKASSKIDSNFMLQIKDHISNGRLDSAKMLCAKEDSPVARLTEKGISRIGSPLEDINSAIENAGKLEVYKLEKNVSMLATIAGAAPMIGFLGTVIGMIITFRELAAEKGSADIANLAGGIQTAMLTTVAGLIVGIVAYIGCNHLVVKTDKVVHQMEENASDFLDLLNEPA